MNNYLKELGKFAGFDTPIRTTHFIGNKRIDETHAKYELIGTHTARRTFICNALALGIPANVIMEWTGHADYKAMMPYIDVANTVKKSMMERFNQE